MSGRKVKKVTPEKQTAARPLKVSPRQHKVAREEGHETKLDLLAKVTDNELKDLKMVFRLTDENGDGSITSEELKRMLRDKLGLKVDDATVTDLMISAGDEASGLISEAQFITWFLKMQSLTSEKSHDISSDLLAAFSLFDRDGNGYITMDELKRAMDLIDERMTDSELNSMIRMADVDKDGKINYEEFLRMLL